MCSTPRPRAKEGMARFGRGDRLAGPINIDHQNTLGHLSWASRRRNAYPRAKPNKYTFANCLTKSFVISFADKVAVCPDALRDLRVHQRYGTNHIATSERQKMNGKILPSPGRQVGFRQSILRHTMAIIYGAALRHQPPFGCRDLGKVAGFTPTTYSRETIEA
jgi:hypothetical protein